MALPNGAGGYQVGDGNVNDPIIDLISAPVSVTATATLTVAQVLNGLILANSGVTSTQTYTLPTVTELEATLINSDRIGTAFSFRVVNLGTSSGTAVIAAGTGLGEAVGPLGDALTMNYADIPNFPVSTVVGHSGRLIAGKLARHIRNSSPVIGGSPPDAVKKETGATGNGFDTPSERKP